MIIKIDVLYHEPKHKKISILEVETTTIISIYQFW